MVIFGKILRWSGFQLQKFLAIWHGMTLLSLIHESADNTTLQDQETAVMKDWWQRFKPLLHTHIILNTQRLVITDIKPLSVMQYSVLRISTIHSWSKQNSELEIGLASINIWSRSDRGKYSRRAITCHQKHEWSRSHYATWSVGRFTN